MALPPRPADGEDPVWDRLSALSLPSNYRDMTGGEIESALDAAWRQYAGDLEARRAPMAAMERDGRPMFGSSGVVSVVFPARKAGDTALASALPGYKDAYEALQRKYPGYAQVGDRALGPQPGTAKDISSWVMDPSAVVYDPEFGYLAPVQTFGQGGKKGETWLQRGGLQAIVALTPAIAGIGYAAAGGAASGGAAAAPNVMQTGAMPGVLGSAGSAAGASIPGTAAFNATMGGGIGAGLPAANAALGTYFAPAGVALPAGSGGGLINSAWQWAKDHPLTTLRGASAVLGGGAEEPVGQTMELQEWMAQNKVSPQQFANVDIGIRPSGATLTNNAGQPVYDTPPRGLINGRL